MAASPATLALKAVGEGGEVRAFDKRARPREIADDLLGIGNDACAVT